MPCVEPLSKVSQHQGIVQNAVTWRQYGASPAELGMAVMVSAQKFITAPW